MDCVFLDVAVDCPAGRKVGGFPELDDHDVATGTHDLMGSDRPLGWRRIDFA